MNYDRRIFLQIGFAGVVTGFTGCFSIMDECRTHANLGLRNISDPNENIINLDERMLSTSHKEIIEETISDDTGYTTCVDEGSNSQSFKKLAKMIFDVTEFNHFRSSRHVMYNNNSYEANLQILTGD